MVYLLHFDPPLKHVSHFAGATRNSIVVAALERGDVSLLEIPIVVAARERGVAVSVARTWPTLYASVDELPCRGNRRRLCPKCCAKDHERRRL